jgi:hypothetical protein
MRHTAASSNRRGPNVIATFVSQSRVDAAAKNDGPQSQSRALGTLQITPSENLKTPDIILVIQI